MSRAPSTLLAQLRQLPKRPSDAQLEPCIGALISYASSARQPAMSAAALLRSQGRALGLARPVVERLSAMVTEHFREARRRQDREERGKSEHLPLKAAARVLGEEEAVLRAKLIDPRQRRLYGWPYWCGMTFMVPLLACRAETRASYLATLPAVEPAAISETLPPWCRREPAGETPAAPVGA